MSGLNSSDSTPKSLLERVETPLGLGDRVTHRPSSRGFCTSSSEDCQEPKRVSRRLEERFDSAANEFKDRKEPNEGAETGATPATPATLPSGSLRHLSKTSNLPSLLGSVASVAEASGVPIQDLWHDLRSYAQVQLVERLVRMADAVDGSDPGGFLFKSQSVGLCYVNPTESMQYGCEMYETLPPVTIRPVLEGFSDVCSIVGSSAKRTTAALSEALLSGRTVTSVIAAVSSDEALIKRYLLEAEKRGRILRMHQGTLMSGGDLGKLFRKAGDKGFVCFHYKLERSPEDNNLVLRGLENGKASLARSNAQLVVTVKKGVGGTAGMKTEARLLDKGALLGLLLGEDPEALLKYYAALSKVESLEQGSAKYGVLSAEDEELLEDKPMIAEKKLPLHSLCCRVDLYLDKRTWSTLSQREVAQLMTATKRFGEHFSAVMRRENWSRHLQHLRTTRAAIMKAYIDDETGDQDDEDVEDVEDDEEEEDEFDDDEPERGTNAKKRKRAASKREPCRQSRPDLTEVRMQIDSLLEDAMESLHTKDSSAAALAQQLFLKMHVSCLALAASRKRSHGNSNVHAVHLNHILPMYMVSTRDCFSSDIVGEDSHLVTDAGRPFVKTKWFIQSSEAPANFDATLEGLCAKEVAASDPDEDDVGDRGDEGDGADGADGPDRDHEGDQYQDRETANISAKSAKDSVDGMVGMILDGMVSTVVQASEAGKDLQPDCADNYMLPLGVTTYNGLYEPAELNKIESSCDDLHQQSVKGILPKECFHETATRTGSLKRTKYFFGSRYLWSREQLKHPYAKVAGGIRRDVPKPPVWMKEMVEQPIVSADLAPNGFVDAIALNMYHDGSEGIQSHYDDAKRFQQPIYSLRLFSDSRLSFGTQLYGFTNGLFFVPMPRGCVTVMENFGYAANGVKHCVRPIDMTGKSAAMILRKINEDAFKVAEELFWKESLQKLGSLSLEPTNAEELVWNPLFDSDSKMDKETSLLLQRHRDEKKAERMIRVLLRSMVKEVEMREKRHHTRKRKVKEVLSGMVKRVCTAERLGIDLCGKVDIDAEETRDSDRDFDVLNRDNLDLFSLMDDMISFCEHPAHSLRVAKAAVSRSGPSASLFHEHH